MNTLAKRQDGNSRTLSPFTNFFDVDDLFGRNWLSPFDRSSMPAVNVSENDKSYMVDVAAPGFRKEDFKVSCDNKVLTISAESKKENKEDDREYSRREYSYSSFTRSFNLPDDAKEDIAATYKDGVLKLTIPKTEEKKRPSRTINIQ